MPVPVLPLPWIKVNELWITPSPAKLYGAGDGSKPPPYNAIYTMMRVATPYGPQVERCWNPADFRPFGVGNDAIAAFIAGMGITTHGITPEIADAYIVFRRPGDPDASVDDFIGQVVEAQIGGGQRSGLSLWVPLTDGQCEWSVRTSTDGTYPLHSSYGFNFSVQAWAR